MNNIDYHIINDSDKNLIETIAEWYLQEWNIPKATTFERLSNFLNDSIPFQILMSVNNIPIATGGIYKHVGLLDHQPQFKKYTPWLALVYTMPANRNKGYGALLCKEIETVAKELGLNELFLFTHTAESLYKRLDWQLLDRIELDGRSIVIMKKEL
jgi:GNAT superfamily N-acetyltransferase